MKRRQFLGAVAAAAGSLGTSSAAAGQNCPCVTSGPPSEMPPGSGDFKDVGSKLRITGVKVYGVTLDAKIARSDRPYVFVKLETNQGIVGWGEATLEGKASAAMACVQDLREFIVGSDPMQSEHLWQLMYIGSFYRGGPVIGSAISGIDQAIWDIRGKALNMPVYKLLGGPVDPRGVRGYYHAQAWTLEAAKALRDQTVAAGVTALKFQLPTYMEWIETNAKLTRAVKSMETLREGLGPDLDFAVDFHAKPSPSVSAILVREIEPFHLLFAEEVCPPENVRAMQRVAKRTTTPLATGERLIASYGFNELIELGVVDVLQPDIAHVGGVTALWKVGALADAAGLRMAPHACEGPIGGIASLHADAAMPNFLVQEICGAVQSGERDQVWEDLLGFSAMRMVDGRYPLPDKPGLGFELNEAALKRYPFKGTVPFPPAFEADGSLASQ
ncbi:MAG TPA: galactonate dehydratase [Bryobacteraceae bacterium]|nr:galactonate dehydratase [Bryobacteraceae bacterium]